MLERLRPDRLRSRAHRQAVLRPEFNIIHAFSPIPDDGTVSADFSARIEADGGWRESGNDLLLTVRVTNTGRAFWPAGRWYPYPVGSVTVGPYLAGPQGERLDELQRGNLPRSVSPGETVRVDLRASREQLAESQAVTVDLVREGLLWFSEAGSDLLSVPIAAP